MRTWVAVVIGVASVVGLGSPALSDRTCAGVEGSPAEPDLAAQTARFEHVQKDLFAAGRAFTQVYLQTRVRRPGRELVATSLAIDLDRWRNRIYELRLPAAGR